MLIDALNSNNYISFNINLAQLYGLECAVYLSELMNIYKKAQIKHKLDKDYFKIDRKFIFTRTSLSQSTQIALDGILMENNLLFKHTDDPDVVKVDFKLLLSLIACDDIELIENIRDRLPEVSAEKKLTKRRIRCEAIKNKINCSNYELLTALRNWVEAVFTKFSGAGITNQLVQIFQNDLNQYTQGDLDMALEIVRIATVQCYKDCKWAISSYERDKAMKKQAQARMPRVTEQERATKDTVRTDIKF